MFHAPILIARMIDKILIKKRTTVYRNEFNNNKIGWRAYNDASIMRNNHINYEYTFWRNFWGKREPLGFYKHFLYLTSKQFFFQIINDQMNWKQNSLKSLMSINTRHSFHNGNIWIYCMICWSTEVFFYVLPLILGYIKWWANGWAQQKKPQQKRLWNPKTMVMFIFCFDCRFIATRAQSNKPILCLGTMSR